MSTRPEQRTRSRKGCLVCRRRKIKCDERRPTCSKCSQLELACQWPSQIQSTGDGPLQCSRRARACRLCSQRRVKCEVDRPGEHCRACVHAGIPCVRTVLKPRGAECSKRLDTAIADGHDGREDADLPSDAVAARLVDEYFNGPHFFCFYTFIHPSTFRRLHRQGQIPASLLLAVFATSLRYIDPQDPIADNWAQKSRNLVMADSSVRFSALNLQTILLLSRYEWHRGAHSSFSMLSAVASRMAYSLQLHKEPQLSALPSLVLETRRRLMWSTFILETMPDPGGHSVNSHLIDPSSITAGYPSNDGTFTGSEQEDVSSTRSCSCDISTHTASLLVLRSHILTYSIAYHPRNETVPYDLERPWLDNSRFAYLERNLRTWGDNLPTALAFSRQSIKSFPEPGRLSSFLTLHFTFYGVHTDLFGIGYFIRRRLLAGRWPQTPFPSPAERSVMSEFLVRCSTERYKNALRALKVLTEVWPLIKDNGGQTDPSVSIAAAMAFRIICLEHLDDSYSAMEVERPELPRRYVEVAMDCIQTTARWSLPTRRLLQALVQFAAKKGIHIALPDLSRMAGDIAGFPSSSSIPTSPTIRNLASDAAIRHSLRTSDRELLSLDNSSSIETPAPEQEQEPKTQHDLGNPSAAQAPLSPAQLPPAQFDSGSNILEPSGDFVFGNLDVLDDYYFCSPDATSWLDQDMAAQQDLDSWIFSVPPP